MKVLYLSALLSTAVATPLPSSAAAGGLKLGKVIYGGSGCPQGSLSLKFSEDGKTVPIDYGKGMNSAIGPGISVEESRKNCQINVELFFQPGFQYSVYSADYTGYANLESGVQGEIKSSYYFSGDAKQVASSFIFEGPIKGQYVKHDEVSAAVWSPCGGSSALFNVNTQVRLLQKEKNSKASGVLTAEESAGQFSQDLVIKAREC